MTEAEIRKAVAKGRGRAILFLRKSGGEKYRDLVLSLCCKDQAFDPMFEDRGDYMCRLVDTVPQRLELVQPLGVALFESRNRRDRAQIRELLGHLYRSGSNEAKEILVRDFYRFRLKDRQFRHATELLGYEGLELLLGQVDRLEDWEIRSIFEDSVKQFGKGRVLSAFQKLAPSKVDLAMNGVQKSPRPKKEELTAAECLCRMALGECTLVQFRRVAKEKDWESAARLALESSDPKVLRRMTLLFHNRT